MSLIELMIAITVLVVGLLALMTLVTVAMTNNNRNKVDTTGTMLAQAVLEGIAARAWTSTSSPTFDMFDCNPAVVGGTDWTIATAPGFGAQLDASGNIDFTNQAYAAVDANYKMQYVSCGVSSQQTGIYDVRWNVQTLTAYTKLVTVSARQVGAAGGNVRFFAPPITLRTVAGQ